jgi:hypothetical protein
MMLRTLPHGGKQCQHLHHPLRHPLVLLGNGRKLIRIRTCSLYTKSQDCEVKPGNKANSNRAKGNRACSNRANSNRANSNRANSNRAKGNDFSRRSIEGGG